MWLGREWGNSSSFPCPSSCNHPPSQTHTHTHSPLPPAHRHHHRYPTENHNVAHLLCQPSHFRCHSNISQDGSFLSAPILPRIRQGLCPPPGTGEASPVGSTDGIRGSWVKRMRSRGEGRRRRWQFRTDRFSLSSFSFNYGSALFSGILRLSALLIGGL